jgi:hypothetical protein
MEGKTTGKTTMKTTLTLLAILLLSALAVLSLFALSALAQEPKADAATQKALRKFNACMDAYNPNEDKCMAKYGPRLGLAMPATVIVRAFDYTVSHGHTTPVGGLMLGPGPVPVFSFPTTSSRTEITVSDHAGQTFMVESSAHSFQHSYYLEPGRSYDGQWGKQEKSIRVRCLIHGSWKWVEFKVVGRGIARADTKPDHSPVEAAVPETETVTHVGKSSPVAATTASADGAPSRLRRPSRKDKETATAQPPADGWTDPADRLAHVWWNFAQ